MDLATKIAVAVLTILAAGFEVVRRRANSRDRIKQDLELLQLLPEGSKARVKLTEHVENRVLKLIEHDEELRRDPTGIAFSVIFFALAAACIGYAVHGGSWWWLLVVPGAFLLLISISGFSQDVRKLKRDEKGRPVKQTQGAAK